MDRLLQRARPVAELLTRQFYEWELWGRGWLVHERPICVEPPFCPFPGHHLPDRMFEDDGVQGTFLSTLTEGLLSVFKPASAPVPSEPDEDERIAIPFDANATLFEITIALGKDEEPSIEVFAHFLSTLANCRHALSFEVVSTKDEITLQIAARESDASILAQQFKAHFPGAVLTPSKLSLTTRWNEKDGVAEIREFGLDREFYIPLCTQKNLSTDALTAICGAVDYLQDDEIGVYQVLFEPVRNDWSSSIWRALTTSDGSPFFEDAPESLKQAKAKTDSPLYAVVVRIAAKTDEEHRTWEILKNLAGALNLFSDPAGNRLVLLENDGYELNDHEDDLLNRSSHRFGMILNAEELISLAHLPTSEVRAKKLYRRLRKTKTPPQVCFQTGIALGVNEHEGRAAAVSLGTNERLRHLHVIGNSGTGKSTFLLNLICQDIYKEHGVAVLDPHGDLIDDILPYIPPERWKDVVLFDAADDEYPIGFNILAAHSELEKTLLASDLVDVFRRLSTSWGDQMRSVLGNAILAFLESERAGTLPELRRFLIEPAFRKEFLRRVTDAEVVYYWEREFPVLKTQSLGPLLTRLDEFLRRKTIRYIVGQPENRLDFAKMMDEGQIFLARLPQGLIGEENSYMLGSLLVSKFHQLAIARQEKEKAQRRPFFLFLDEFHHFITPTLETILSGGRKYGLGLTLAHQSVHQLDRGGNMGQGVLSMCGSRVVFRVGDDDAKKLADGFSVFERTDLQSLENYEAICRVDRRENDFNFRTVKPPELDEAAEWRRSYLRYLSRLNYGTPRQSVEEFLAKSRAVQSEIKHVDPFLRRTTEPQKRQPASEIPSEEKSASPVPEKPLPVSTPPPPKPQEKVEVDDSEAMPEERRQHESIKRRIMQEAEVLGYMVEWERLVLDGKGRVDLVLSRGAVAIACEVSVTTTIEHEVQNVLKCMRAGFRQIAIVCMSRRRLSNLEKAVKGALTGNEGSAVGFYTPAEFVSLITAYTASDHENHGEKTPRKQGINLRQQFSDDERRRREREMLRALASRMRVSA
jgi:DNA helicase HerA-like ATPase